MGSAFPDLHPSGQVAEDAEGGGAYEAGLDFVGAAVNGADGNEQAGDGQHGEDDVDCLFHGM